MLPGQLPRGLLARRGWWTLRRLWLYQGEYGWTVTRLNGGAFELWVVLLLIAVGVAWLLRRTDLLPRLTAGSAGLGLLAVTSPDLLHRGWSAGTGSHADALLGALAPGARLVTLLDGSPAALSWLGGVRGQRVVPLGLDRFGQTGTLPDLYGHYRLDEAAITDAVARVLI